MIATKEDIIRYFRENVPKPKELPELHGQGFGSQGWLRFSGIGPLEMLPAGSPLADPRAGRAVMAFGRWWDSLRNPQGAVDALWGKEYQAAPVPKPRRKP